MNAASGTPSARGPKAYQVIFLGGLIAGALDITAACLVSWLRAGVSPIRVLQSVASGLLGAASSAGGVKTAALGLALHFLIATIWTAVFYFASRKLRFMVARPIPVGLLYGVVVYLFMNFIVIPLSAVPRRGPPPLSGRIIGLLVIMFCVGLPVSLVVSRFARRG